MRTHESAGPSRDSASSSPARSSRPRTLDGLQSTLGNAVTTRLITVSRMMTPEAFRESTSTRMPRGRSRITEVDAALAAFQRIPEDDPRARSFALRAVIDACRTYTSRKPADGSRVAGTEELARQAAQARTELDLESVYRGLLEEIDLLLAQNLHTMEQTDQAHMTAQSIPADRFHTMMSGYVEQLGGLRSDDTLPEETRAVIGELMAVVPLVKVLQYPWTGRPGMKLDAAAEGQDQSYSFNVGTQAPGGTPFLLGHIAHELTHVAAHQAFGSSPAMELVESGATVKQVAALAEERRKTLEGLQSALHENAGFTAPQYQLLDEKLSYGAQPGKLESYAIGLAGAGRITEEQKKRLMSWGEAAGAASGTLVEYDTVLNQMLVYLHMWGISEKNPFYVRLLAASGAARTRRDNARGNRSGSGDGETDRGEGGEGSASGTA
ncbi:hypothetical protein ACIOEW_12760 [Streptomyces sp. NPDC087901]|uniref:hypothetical protein n=1 Tax=Streptomyces sp. NPDC087901 TaxID=3365818 RepID=UPI003816D83E